MKALKIFYRSKIWFCCFGLHFIIILFNIPGFSTISAQTCPSNIDFESGTFEGWICYTGSVADIDGKNVITLYPLAVPVGNRHTMYGPNAGVDPYGGFPVNCPNGSSHSIRLGNNEGGAEAEGVSYEFVIPSDRDAYSLVYHYAVVFEDPGHEIPQQPRMEIEITNVTDNTVISCSSFSFYPFGSVLPGFFLSKNPVRDAPVLCKDWSAVSVNLDGMAGKTIRLFFKTADCTFKNHFGYAYIDVNSECSSEFKGAAYCTDDTAVSLVAPYGYQDYTWYNNSFSQVLGAQQTLLLKPAPPAGTVVAVKVGPYNGYGCLDTFYVKLTDTLKITAHAGADALYCNEPVALGFPAKPDLSYRWSPANGLSNPDIANPFAAPVASTNYVVTVSHSGGGCRSSDTVVVRSAFSDNPLQLAGKESYCLGSGDSAILRVKPTDSIQWFKDGVPINGARETDYRVTETGLYHAFLFNNAGCIVSTAKKLIVIDKTKPGITYPVKYAAMNLPLSLQARQFGSAVSWAPVNNLDEPSSYNPVFTGAANQLYTIAIKTNSGCVTRDTQLVKIIKEGEVYVPTAFTPNGDGLNDFLRPVGIKELHYFRIYNRWGQLIFEMKTGRPGWDGYFKGLKQETQVVVWTVDGIGVDGHAYTRKGTSLLIR